MTNTIYVLYFTAFKGRHAFHRQWKKIVNIPKPGKKKLWFWDTLKATGLEPLCHTSFGKLNHGLLTAFPERWHPETSSFHLHVGELAITLDDVQC
ncbi:protein-serine/threonine phosphatase [Trifolium repens]|nr:protein-serine/threonine phosphatase [Trifolium repens]